MSTTPSNGFIFIEGTAVGPYGVIDQNSCGNVSNQPGDWRINYQYDSRGALRGLYYINLGSSRCDDSKRGTSASDIAVHETGHAMGLFNHFSGFGYRSIISTEFFIVLYNLYKNPVGTDFNNLNIELL